MRLVLSHPLRGAVLATAVLSGVLLGYAIDSPLTAYTVLSGSAGVAAGLAAIVMAARAPFPARLTATVVCVCAGLAAVLAMTVGMPGTVATGLTLRGATLVACALLVPVLLAVHATSRPPGRRTEGPYAP